MDTNIYLSMPLLGAQRHSRGEVIINILRHRNCNEVVRSVSVRQLGILIYLKAFCGYIYPPNTLANMKC